MIPLQVRKFKKPVVVVKNQAEAYAYISALPPLFSEIKVNIATIGKYMYISGSDHVNRLEKLGKKPDFKTLRDKRHLLELFIEEFGNYEIHEMTIPMIMNYLIQDEHSGSWKNNFLTVVGNVYDEAPFFGILNITKSTFTRFARNTVKKDIFTTDELNTLFNESLWQNLIIKCTRNSLSMMKDIVLFF